MDDQLDEICSFSGTSTQEERDELKVLDVFQLKHVRSFSFSKYFPNLTELILNQQRFLTSISGIGVCFALEKLIISDTSITSIDADLKKCESLNELVINNSQIRDLDGLPTLLRKLSLCGNKIIDIAGIKKLWNLKELWLARNYIDSIGTHLDGMKDLEILNLADNNISSFLDIRNLSRLKNLKSLYLSDEHYGENPVCQLSNYQVYTICHLAQVSILDSIPVNQEAKTVTEATFLKKRMYYNMRIKTLKRNATNVIRKAMDCKQGVISSINLKVNVLMRQKKIIEREIDEMEEKGNIASIDYIQELKEKLASISTCMLEQSSPIEQIREMCLTLEQKVRCIADESIGHLVLELETGGNIRLVEGTAADSWFTFCSEFLQQHLVGKSARVSRALKIHNRFLKNRLNNRVQDIIDMSGKSSDEWEYMLYFDDELASNINDISQYGFSNHSQPGVLLHSFWNGEITKPRGKLILAKAFLGNYSNLKSLEENSQVVESEGSSCSTKQKRSYFSKRKQTKFQDTNENLWGNENTFGFHSVFEEAEDSRFRKWFFVDTSLILPEFIIEYDLQEEPLHEANEPIASYYDEPMTKQEIQDIGPLMQPLIQFTKDIEKYQSGSEIDIENETKCNRIVKLEPIIAQRKHMSSMSTKKILKWTKQPTLESIIYLNLHGNRIQEIQNLETCATLETLILSFNEISEIEGLTRNVHLKRLDLGFNIIKNIQGLDSLMCLEHLELNNNLIHRIEELKLLQNNQVLHQLNLHNNAICECSNYMAQVIRVLPKLSNIANVEIIDSAKTQYLEGCIQMTPEFILSKSKCINNLDKNQLAVVETLSINMAGITEIKNTEKLVNLRRAFLTDNRITEINGFLGCLFLEELSLEGNQITKITGLDNCTFLKKLDLSKNHLRTIEGLENLRSPAQLSMEDNAIDCLDGLSSLNSLMELYIGNNNVQNLKQIKKLCNLPRLVIMDLVGNPVAENPDYRTYSTYYVRKLKVLDGTSIDHQQVLAANNMYVGKLNSDMLQEKVGHCTYEHVHELDLCSSNIRSIQPHTITGSLFTSLRELNLSNNSLTSIAGFSYLPSLQVLRLNNNSIKSFSDSLQGENHTGIFALSNLEVLQLGFNKIADLSNLHLGHLTNLKILFLQGNEINSISGIGACTQLRELVLDKNKFRTLENMEDDFSMLVNLRTLRLEDNGIKTLGYLNHLSNLHSLYLGLNRISDISEIQKLCVIPFLLELHVPNNPVSRKQMYRPMLVQNMPSLKLIDGKEITVEERERIELMFTPDTAAYSSHTIVSIPIVNQSPNTAVFIKPIEPSLGKGIPLEITGNLHATKPQLSKSKPKFKPKGKKHSGSFSKQFGSASSLPQVFISSTNQKPESEQNRKYKMNKTSSLVSIT